MYKVFKSILDDEPVTTSREREDAKISAKWWLTIYPNVFQTFIFFQDEEMKKTGKMKLAYIVTREEIFDIEFTLDQYFEVKSRNAFQKENTIYCREPRLFKTVETLLSHDGTIVSILPRSSKALNETFNKPLPF